VRNHKKLIVADKVAYVGGINFSDHNFAWHDMMLRIEGAGPADFLAGDFDATFAGAPAARAAAFPGIRLQSLDGRNNRNGFASLFSAIADAQHSIDVISAYPTFPFVDALIAAAARGTRVRILTPLPNNKAAVRDYLLAEVRGTGIEVGLLPRMTHLKAMLIDGTTMVAGSSNFDFASYQGLEELLATVDDPALVEQFRTQVLLPALEEALPEHACRPSPRRAAACRIALRGAEAAVKAMSGVRRSSVPFR
jgi:cardiolipin synthase